MRFSQSKTVEHTKEVRHESRTKITSQVNGIASFPTEASTNTEDDEEKTQRCQWSSSDVTLIFQSVNQEHEQTTGDQFREKLSRLGHEWLWVGAEDSGCGGFTVSRDCADVGTSLIDIDGGFIVGVYDAGSAHGSEDLCEGVNWEFSPWEFSEDTIGECDWSELLALGVDVVGRRVNLPAGFK